MLKSEYSGISKQKNPNCVLFMKTRMILAALLCSAALASAQSLFTASLDSAQETGSAANNSSATGDGTFTLNPDGSLSYNVTYSGLQGTWSANHIHGPAAPGASAGVLYFLNHSSTGPGSGVLSGTTPVLTSQQIDWLNDELLYVNIHSSFSSGGEIRGQIVPVPEPSTWALMGFGALATLWAARRRRAK
jgi:hypothetical protein